MPITKDNYKDILVKILFVLGIFVIVLILAFAIIKIIPRIFSSFSTIGNVIQSPFSKNELIIGANETNLDSGEKTIIFWDYSPEELGTYNIEYPCIDELEVLISVDNSEKKLLCDTPYKLNSNISSIEITAILNAEGSLIDFPLSIKFASDNDNVLASDSIEITVKNEIRGSEENNRAILSQEIINDGDEEVVSETSTPRYTRSNYVGLPDLAITNLMAISDQVVSFRVSNIGSSNTGNWFFSYINPNGKVEFSPLQISMRPGEIILYTLNFDGISSGTVRINIDPSNLVRESNEANNISAVFVKGNGSNINNPNYNINDRADLDIILFEVGRIRRSVFVEDDEIDDNEEAAVRFIVKNIGGESTGTWRFEIDNVPYDNEDTYRSDRQTSLRPGESREIIISFDNPDEGNYRVNLEVDSEDDVREENEKNNKASDRLEVQD